MTTVLKTALLTALIAGSAVGPLSGQTTGEPPFRLHGYITQGAGASESLPVVGLSTTGTTDYRTVALQARYRVDDRSNVVVQMSHRRIGDSPLASLEPALELDWAFYRRSIGPVVVNAGRIPMPRGFYNEIRDVGTLLPFFRAPTTIYPDGTEAVDGLAATTRVDLGRWSVEANAFAGGTEWKGVVRDDEQLVPTASRSEVSFGSQLWLATPITGVRAGIFYYNFEDVITEDRRGAAWVASGEIDRDRWMVRSEVADIRLTDYVIRFGYAHGRFKVTPQIHLTGQYEQSNMEISVPVDASWTEMKDGALGIAFAPSPSVIFKLEGHRAEGYAFDVPMDRFGAPASSSYAILSMSVSF